MNLRSVEAEDAKQLVELMRQLGYEATESELLSNISAHNQDNNSWAYVIELDGKLAASASFHLIPFFHCKGSLMRVTSLVVDKNHKRKGLGEILMDKAESLANEHQCEKVELTTSQHRKGEAHLFYESIGYKAYDGVRYLKYLNVQ